MRLLFRYFYFLDMLLVSIFLHDDTFLIDKKQSQFLNLSNDNQSLEYNLIQITIAI